LTWEGNVLVVETRLGDGEVTLSDRLTLSPDGNTIRMTRKMKGPDGEGDRELILEKQGAAKPNFSGTWKVIIARSDFGAVPAPASMISKIDHQDPALKISTVTTGSQGERSYDLTFTTGGAETSNTAGNMVYKTTCRWEDGALLMDSRADEGDLIGKDKWTLSEDGKTLTLLRVWSGSQGETTQRLVHEKQ
jgi:hypothetical protein